MTRILDIMQAESTRASNDAANLLRSFIRATGKPQKAPLPNALGQLLQAGRK